MYTLLLLKKKKKGMRTFLFCDIRQQTDAVFCCFLWNEPSSSVCFLKWPSSIIWKTALQLKMFLFWPQLMEIKKNVSSYHDGIINVMQQTTLKTRCNSSKDRARLGLRLLCTKTERHSCHKTLTACNGATRNSKHSRCCLYVRSIILKRTVGFWMTLKY